MIHGPAEFQQDFQVETDVVIVGAGPGGAAAAYKLTSLGKRVIILEAGGMFTPGDFSRDGIKSLRNLYQDAGQRYTTGNAFFPTMFGKGVGGGSLINSGISFRPPDKAVRRWQEEGKLEDFTPLSLKPYVEEVEKNVNIEVLDVSKLGRNNTVFKDGLEKLGYKGATIPRNTKNCGGCGVCFFGCPSGAKQSVDKNFINSAREKGAEVYTYARVVRIDYNEKSGKIESLIARIADPQTGNVRARMTVKASHFALAAGAIGTPKLLIKSGIGNSSGQIGKNFRCHPSSGVIGVFPEVINGFNGATQGYYSDEFFDQEILLETFWCHPGVLAAFVPELGADSIKAMKEVRHFAGAGAMIRDESAGELKFTGEKLEIFYDVVERDLLLLTEGLFRSAEVLFAAGARLIYADNPRKTKFSTLSELRDYFSRVKNLGPDIIREGNHGLGTCRMGSDSKTSVVNSYGRSHDIKNLWIFDVSAFPSALGVNPQITIMALALRGADYLNRNFS